MKLWHQELPSPVGRLKLVADDDSLLAVLWENDRPRRVPLSDSKESATHSVLQAAARQLREYFDGGRRSFDIPMKFYGTIFQNQVWNSLLNIAAGETWSYGQLALFVGRPSAARAVGAAVGRNPISIILPCHRVVGTKGALTGFAGGLERKALLLALESKSEQFPIRRSDSSEALSLE